MAINLISKHYLLNRIPISNLSNHNNETVIKNIDERLVCQMDRKAAKAVMVEVMEEDSFFEV